MESPKLSPAKAILLAVQLTAESRISSLRAIVARHPKTLHNELVLRILLSHLPETLESSEYVPFLQDLKYGTLEDDEKVTVDQDAFAGLGDAEARRQVRKLGLLPLAWPNSPADAPADPLVQFLIHRSLRIDEYTGLLTHLPILLAPFLHLSPYLRTWFISSVLPLLRLNYEYYPDFATGLTIPKFESLDDRAGVSLLLAGSGQNDTIKTRDYTTIGRDLRGLVGPWMYGDSRWKRRRLRENFLFERPTIKPQDEAPAPDHKYAAWEEVFNWIVNEAGTTWKLVVDAVEQWDGPGDVDLGGLEDGTTWLDEDEQQYLERRYARAVIAAAYLIPEESEEALYGIQRILTRIITLLDKDRIPTLQVATALLSPVPNFDKNVFVLKNTSFLRGDLLGEYNVLTNPNDDSISLLHALLISSFLCARVGCFLSIKRAGELVLLQDKSEQNQLFSGVISNIINGPKGDDKYWIKIRKELLWLRSWDSEESAESTSSQPGRGIFGSLPKSVIETQILKALLANTRYTLARSIYEMSPAPPLSKEELHDTVIYAAMNAYDNATNASKTRGGVKKCYDILQAFPDTLQQSVERSQVITLVNVTDLLGQYRLVFKQGEPFKPVQIRVHADPISIIGKVLEQNPKSFAKITDMIYMGKQMVRAGLTIRNVDGGHVETSESEFLKEEIVAQRRVVAMCIDAALAEDDFETAYSYIATRLKSIERFEGSTKSKTSIMEHENVPQSPGLHAEVPPHVLDDWSWRAALQAGKYRRDVYTTKPEHFGSASENLDIRHVELRMDCLAQALRLAPKAALQEVLNVYRRCEEELESLTKQEAEKEAEAAEAWNAQKDGHGADQVMPGGFSTTPAKNITSNPRLNEEAPVSLFDLSREGIARAQSGLAALSSLRSNNRKTSNAGFPLERALEAESSSVPKVRKRDQLRNVAVGGLASSVGWLIGAQPVATRQSEEDTNSDSI